MAHRRRSNTASVGRWGGVARPRRAAATTPPPPPPTTSPSRSPSPQPPNKPCHSLLPPPPPPSSPLRPRQSRKPSVLPTAGSRGARRGAGRRQNRRKSAGPGGEGSPSLRRSRRGRGVSPGWANPGKGEGRGGEEECAREAGGAVGRVLIALLCCILFCIIMDGRASHNEKRVGKGGHGHGIARGGVLIFIGVLGSFGAFAWLCAGVGKSGLRTVDRLFVLGFVQCVLLRTCIA